MSADVGWAGLGDELATEMVPVFAFSATVVELGFSATHVAGRTGDGEARRDGEGEAMGRRAFTPDEPPTTTRRTRPAASATNLGRGLVVEIMDSRRTIAGFRTPLSPQGRRRRRAKCRQPPQWRLASTAVAPGRRLLSPDLLFRRARVRELRPERVSVQPFEARSPLPGTQENKRPCPRRPK
jgi:hypothetical protein